MENQQKHKENNKSQSEKFAELIKEVILFALVLIVVMGVALGIFYLLKNELLINNEFYFHILWYPLACLAMIIWIIGIKKDNIKRYLLNKPSWPKPHHRWFYILYFIFFVIFISGWVVILSLGSEWGYIDYPINLLIVSLTHSCIGAPLVEEILFRGYIHEKSEEVWGKDGWYINWKLLKYPNSQDENVKVHEKRVMNFRITFAALFSSFLFGVWHLNVIQSIYTFFGGLIFVKTRREWGKTLIAPIILHSTWNLMAQVFVITNFPIMPDIINWMVGLF
ncbi:MAG: CPBP family intramembrane metalloprotease [Candidatus Lokiarchaeota archaeon]|nr:CPBP family intramembrane metalloprotease [Candidatus Lokiarchaeota archaeon]